MMMNDTPRVTIAFDILEHYIRRDENTQRLIDRCVRDIRKDKLSLLYCSEVLAYFGITEEEVMKCNSED